MSIKFPMIQHLRKLSDFIRESGEFLSLYLYFLTVVDAALLIYNMLMFKCSVCCCASPSQLVVNYVLILIRCILSWQFK